MEASEAGHTEIVRMLLDAGATLKQEKKVEMYLLALIEGQVEIML